MSAPIPTAIVRVCWNGWQYDRPAHSEKEVTRLLSLYTRQRKTWRVGKKLVPATFKPEVFVYHLSKAFV